MLYIIIAIVIFIVFLFVRMARRSLKGAKYWKECEQKYHELLRQGYSNKDALINISKSKHPELADVVHEKIVDKFSDINELVLFIYNALDFRPAWRSKYGRKLSNEEAEALVEFTTISEKGIINTDFTAVRGEIGRDTPNF